jgi:hypothetical protein
MKIEIIDLNTNKVVKERTLCTISEGVVWVGWFNDTKHNFKVKGEKHANSKVKKLKVVDEAKEKAKIEFANYATPAWRLEQAVQEVCDTLNGGVPDIKQMGQVIKWVMNDIVKEELDELGKTGLSVKDVSKPVSDITRRWYQDMLNSLVGL